MASFDLDAFVNLVTSHLPSEDYDAKEDDKDNPAYDRSKVGHTWRRKIGRFSFPLRIKSEYIEKGMKSCHWQCSQREYSACSQGSLSDDYIQDVMRSDMIYNKITWWYMLLSFYLALAFALW